jgi:hypothetical protein
VIAAEEQEPVNALPVHPKNIQKRAAGIVPAAPALLESPSAYYFSSGDWLKPFDRKHSLRPGRQATITDVTCRLVLSTKSTIYTSTMT